MSEENLQKPAGEATGEGAGVSVPQGTETFDVTIDKSANQLTIRDPNTGRVVTLKARVTEPPEETEFEQDVRPLTPDEFRDALHRLDTLGVTWTADRMPRLVTKDEASDDAFLSEEYQQLQAKYPALPREVGAVVFHTLTGVPVPGSIVGSKDDLLKKVAIVQDLLITSEYRSEFFFKHAIKVPYFESIDWEVIFKTHERNVDKSPAIAYALLMLTFHNTNPRVSRLDEHQNMTVAADLNLVNKLIGTLIDIKAALEDTKQLADRFVESQKRGEDDAEIRS